MADPIVREIKDRLDIADVIGGYIPLKKAGAVMRKGWREVMVNIRVSTCDA